ncbi:MAG TPA: SH3 domain-containing C40 family peptidase [Bacteroidales bacterium]|nr:SH3 domain-containing C40 family peptidase [Bacteroidales bacterium]
MKALPIRFLQYLPVVFMLTMLITCSSCNNYPPEGLQNTIDVISEKWVPDQREGVAEIFIARADNNSIILKGETDCLQFKNEVIDSVSARGFTIIDSVLVLPGNDVGDKTYGVVIMSVINLRQKPAHSEELVSQSIMGTPVRILKNTGYWMLIQTPDNYIAWTEAGSVQLMTESEFKEWKESEKVIFIDNSGWIYENIKEEGVVGDVVAGCILKSDGRKGSFEKVILADGREGYLKSKAVREYKKWINELKPSGRELYRVASSLMGLPYLWGGRSAKGVDCSGFVQTVYFMNGIILSRDASLQALHGNEVDISNGWNNLETGDLLFFGSVRNSKPRVTHVAIYKGDSEFINSAGMVKVNSLDSTRINFSSYRKNTLLSARRIIGSVGTTGITAIKDHHWY